MILRKKEYPQQKINWLEKWRGIYSRILLCQSEGQVQWVVGLFWVLFLGILLSVQLQVKAFASASLYLEDALAASNLASAVVDLQEYGRTHTIQIADPGRAYALYCEAVHGNLQLNEQWEGLHSNLISGQVVVETYIVYNVNKNRVTVYSLDSNGQMKVWEDTLGAVWAPNGICIESTSVYSEISFPVKGLLGIRVEAHKGKLVDVVGPFMG